MKNIFEGAKFGDKFVNRVGKIFIFQKIDSNNYATLFAENSVWSCPLDGKNGEVENEFDVIGKYQESIDEDKLQKAMDEVNVQVSSLLGNTKYRKMNEFEKQIFKTGYHKAKEE